MLPHHLGDPRLQLLTLLAPQLPETFFLDMQADFLFFFVLDLEDVFAGCTCDWRLEGRLWLLGAWLLP